MSTTRVSRLVRAPRAAAYAALVDPEQVVRWKVPAGMSCVIHDYDVREGGRLRVSLTYETADGVCRHSLVVRCRTRVGHVSETAWP